MTRPYLSATPLLLQYSPHVIAQAAAQTAITVEIYTPSTGCSCLPLRTTPACRYEMFHSKLPFSVLQMFTIVISPNVNVEASMLSASGMLLTRNLSFYRSTRCETMMALGVRSTRQLLRDPWLSWLADVCRGRQQVDSQLPLTESCHQAMTQGLLEGNIDMTIRQCVLSLR